LLAKDRGELGRQQSHLVAAREPSIDLEDQDLGAADHGEERRREHEDPHRRSRTRAKTRRVSAAVTGHAKRSARARAPPPSRASRTRWRSTANASKSVSSPLPGYTSPKWTRIGASAGRARRARSSRRLEPAPGAVAMFEPIGISVQRFASPGNRRRIMALTSSLALIEWAAVARSHG